MNTDYIFVQSDADLAPLLIRWRSRPWLALDTEFVREDTYWPKLALLQVCDGEAPPVCVDLQAVTIDKTAALIALLRDEKTLKVFHSASQDLEVLTRLCGECPAPLFDTQIAAALLGEAEQAGYATLVEKRLGVKLDKAFTRLDWTRRPIPEGALRYAADDVRYLAQVYPMLVDELRARGRLAWAEEDCASQTDSARYRPDPASAWRRLKGLARLPAAAQHRAARLAQWREQTALERDRPRKWIVDDELLYALATRAPRTPDELKSLAPTPKQLERYATRWLELLAAPGDAAPLKTETVWTAEQKTRLAELGARVQAKAKELGIGAPLLATRADLEAQILLGDSALMRGWRREVFGTI